MVLLNHCEVHERFNPKCKDCISIKNNGSEIQSSPSLNIETNKKFLMVMVDQHHIISLPELFDKMDNDGYDFLTQITYPTMIVNLIFKKRGK